MSGGFSKYIAAFVMFAFACAAEAAVPIWADIGDVTVCPATGTAEPPPDFTAPGCTRTNLFDVDPQNRLIWVRTYVDLERITGPEGAPLSLYVSGKMAGKFYMNGAYVGSNGMPGTDAADERSGLMDAELYPPQDLYRTGRNEIVFLASAHRGYIDLGNPLHMIAIGPAADGADALLRHYWPSLLTLGLFIMAWLYFGVSGLIGQNRARALTLSLISGFAAAQLVAEVWRGLFPYIYPVHDLRLAAIALFSAGFGLTVAFHVLTTFGCRYLWRMMAVLSALSAACIYFAYGFDAKAVLAMSLPLVGALAVSGYWTYRRRPRAFGYFLSLLVFIAAIYLSLPLFLDVVFFYLVAAFLFFLFIEQAYAMRREQARRQAEEARADRLEMALEQARERDAESEVIIRGAGKIEHVPTSRISHCRGADGYSEIMTADGRELLHSATLAEMEETLPATFLRVHRSYLVNTAYVKSLTRDASGTGTLALTDGSEIPVSRRTMPYVRQALG